MAKKPPRNGKKEARPDRDSTIRPPAVPSGSERTTETVPLVELKPGLFLNMDHIVSVRVLSQEENEVYAIMQLSNGDKHNLTRAEFTTVTAREPCLTGRVHNTR
jgi:hypothetical protein